MEHYVTLFDCLFLPQGLALHMSMERHIKSYTLWILCVNDEVFRSLDILQLRNVKLLKLSNFENHELLKVKAERTIGEYCWTLSPFAPKFVFDTDSSIARVTYVDSDVWFLNKPLLAFDELEQTGKSVLITKHAFHPEYEYSYSSGIYCVQFMTFVKGPGDEVLKWWQDRCLEWCYSRLEDGKFGDQLYLNHFVDLFPTKVHVLQYGGHTLAPWNVQRYPYGNAFLYHFQGLRIITRSRVLLGPALALPKSILSYVYKPYLIDIKNSLELMINNNIKLKQQRKSVGLVERIVSILREIQRIFYKLGRIRIWEI